MTPPTRRPPTPEVPPPKRPNGRGWGISDRTANIITIAVATLWVVAQSVGIFTAMFPQLPDVHPPPELTAVFTLIVGTAFLARNKGKDDQP